MLSTILNDTVRDANRLFNSAFGPMGQPIASGGPVGRMPGVNLWRTSDHCVAEMELPGYRMEDLEVLVLLREHGFDTKTKVELREGTIDLGERVAVVGRVRRSAVREGTGGSYRQPPQQIALEAPDDHPLIVSDDPDTFGA